MGHAKTR
jgi:hypothetical protein